MHLSEAAAPVFARHETFHPRYGWFRKAYTAACRDPHVFASEEAPVRPQDTATVMSETVARMNGKRLTYAALTANALTGPVAERDRAEPW